jgi:hypothetical protein
MLWCPFQEYLDPSMPIVGLREAYLVMACLDEEHFEWFVPCWVTASSLHDPGPRLYWWTMVGRNLPSPVEASKEFFGYARIQRKRPPLV